MSIATTGSWNSVPYLLDVLERTAPGRVLDVGVGRGRWGVLVRCFGDLWCDRVPEEGAPILLAGIELSHALLPERLRGLYDKLEVVEGDQLAGRLDESFDLTIYGSGLETFTKPDALRLLGRSLAGSSYVLVHVPIGVTFPGDHDDAIGVVRSFWEPGDFSALPAIHSFTYVTTAGLPRACVLLSGADPRRLRGSFARTDGYRFLPDGAWNEQTLINRIRDMAAELRYVKNHRWYRLGRRLRNAGVTRLLRRLRYGDGAAVIVRALGTRHADAGGQEVWLLHAGAQAGDPAIPWDFIACDDTWTQRESDDLPHGRCLISRGGELCAPASDDPELRFLRHAWSGRVEVRFRGRTEVIDLYAPAPGTLTVYPGRSPMIPDGGPPAAAPATPAVRPGKPLRGAAAFSRQQRQFIETMRSASAPVVAVHVPRWLGVTGSTRALFEHTYPVPESPVEEPTNLDPAYIARHADVLCEAGVRHVVFSGGDEQHYLLARELHRRNAKLRLDLLWHGGYVFFSKDYDWRVLTMWIEAAREGVVRTIGTVKKGMESFFHSTGIESRLVLNYLPAALQPMPDLPTEEWHVGMWMSDNFWKSPHAMLSAVRMMPGTRLHAAGLGARARAVVRFFDIPTEIFYDGTLPRDELAAHMRRTHLTLYVTFFECCPMLPLESFSVGVPCLIGPNSHLFEDNPYLFERLVVPFPDRADVIAVYAMRALRERAAIMEEYTRYIPAYNDAARRSVAAFLA